MKEGLLIIRTPEGVSFPLILAGPVTRFLAVLIDWACISAASVVMVSLLGFLRVFDWDFATAAGVIGYFVLSFGYPIFAEWRWRGQTIGKRLLKLRVMDAQGLHLHLSQIVIRNLLRAVDFLPAFYFLGGAICLFSKRSQRLGDFAGNTIVVRNPEVENPDIAQIRSSKYNSLREYPHLIARLRRQISPKEASTALQALIRRDQMEPLARLELFHDIADHFRQSVVFPQEATDGLTDEQYVRNVIEILFV